MQPLASLKRAYAGSMRGIRRGLDRRGPGGGAPPLDRRWRHWAYSLTIVHDSRAMAALDVPWWTYRAIETVEKWLSARPNPARVFEYGSGASTVWLARRAGEVHSVEHHRAFAELMHGELVSHPNASVRVVEAVSSPRPVVPSSKEGHEGLDFAEYVAAIDEVPGSFDLVVIDGRAREACLAAAVGRLADDGLVVFDNSRRRRYRAAIARSGLQERVLRGLTPTLPYPEQTSLLTSR
jgi:predicted O-methyltransferase YrrM